MFFDLEEPVPSLLPNTLYGDCHFLLASNVILQCENLLWAGIVSWAITLNFSGNTLVDNGSYMLVPRITVCLLSEGKHLSSQ